jgi:diguanylate cyclase (GGDEF)-like protein
MSILVLDRSGTAQGCVLAQLHLEEFGPVRFAGSIAEILGEVTNGQTQELFADAVILDLAEDPELLACRQIRAASAAVWLLVLFDERSASQLEGALNAGATDCISKPVNLLELSARLRLAARARQCDESFEGARSGPVTQLEGERSFVESLGRAWRRNHYSQLPLTLVVINVDHLASYNQRNGHAVGDQGLQRIASALIGSLFRPDDLVAHRGGGEFVVLLPGTDRTGAAVVAERLRNSVLDLAIPHAGSPGWQRLTISLGVAIARPAPDLAPEDLIMAAERALSRAKLDGRNRLAIEGDVLLRARA